jgi:hypothetical protein
LDVTVYVFGAGAIEPNGESPFLKGCGFTPVSVTQKVTQFSRFTPHFHYHQNQA